MMRRSTLAFSWIWICAGLALLQPATLTAQDAPPKLGAEEAEALCAPRISIAVARFDVEMGHWLRATGDCRKFVNTADDGHPRVTLRQNLLLSFLKANPLIFGVAVGNAALLTADPGALLTDAATGDYTKGMSLPGAVPDPTHDLAQKALADSVGGIVSRLRELQRSIERTKIAAIAIELNQEAGADVSTAAATTSDWIEDFRKLDSAISALRDGGASVAEGAITLRAKKESVLKAVLAYDRLARQICTQSAARDRAVTPSTAKSTNNGGTCESESNYLGKTFHLDGTTRVWISDFPTALSATATVPIKVGPSYLFEGISLRSPKEQSTTIEVDDQWQFTTAVGLLTIPSNRMRRTWSIANGLVQPTSQDRFAGVPVVIGSFAFHSASLIRGTIDIGSSLSTDKPVLIVGLGLSYKSLRVGVGLPAVRVPVLDGVAEGTAATAVTTKQEWIWPWDGKWAWYWTVSFVVRSFSLFSK